MSYIAGYPSTSRNGVPSPAETDAWVRDPKPAPTDPTQEYLAGGPREYRGWPASHVLTHEIDDVTRAFGPELYESMILDAAIAGCFTRIISSVLSGPIHVAASVAEIPGRHRSSEMSKAKEIADQNRENLSELSRPIDDVCKEMILAMGFGNKLAEVPKIRRTKGGPEVVESIEPKDYWSWNFGVDRTGKILGFIPTPGTVPLDMLPMAAYGSEGTSSGDGTILGVGPLLDPDHFAIATWDGRGGNPQGHSVLRPVYSWWNEKRQAVPDYRKYIKRFATPKPIARFEQSTIPGQSLAGMLVPKLDPKTLQVIPGQTMPAYQALLMIMQRYDNDSAIVLPDGAIIEFKEPVSNGEAFEKFFGVCDTMIVRAFFHTAQGAMEAKRSSQASTGTAQDTETAVCHGVGAWLGRWIRGIYYRCNVGNYGAEAARKYTPEFVLGQTEHQDFATTARAAASVSYRMAPSQFAAMDAKLGLPERTEDPNEVAGQGDPVDTDKGGGKKDPNAITDDEDDPGSKRAA